jgi:hypothetical protein
MSMPARSGAVPTVPLVTAGTALAALPVLYNVDPSSTHLPLCPLHAVTGLNCPLCGATRATYALLHGQLSTALHDNALYVVALPFLLWLWYRWFNASGSQVLQRRTLPRTIWIGLIVVASVFGIVRNLPAGDWLSPPG